MQCLTYAHMITRLVAPIQPTAASRAGASFIVGDGATIPNPEMMEVHFVGTSEHDGVATECVVFQLCDPSHARYTATDVSIPEL